MRVFVEVVRRGGIGAASEALQMPKSTVSLKVKQLEERLAIRLLHRNTRKLNLTSEGQLYFERAQEVVSLAEDADREILQASKEVRGVLRIATFQLFADEVLPGVVAEFLQRYPDVELQIWVAEAIEDVVGEGIDLTIRGGELKDSDLIARKLGELEIWFCASPDFWERQGAPSHPSGLEGLPYLRYGRSRPPQAIVMNRGEEEHEHVPNASLFSTSIRMLANVVSAGSGFAGIPRILAEPLVAKGRLVRLFEDWDMGRLFPPVYVVHANRSHMAPALRAFLDLLAELVDDELLNGSTSG